MKMKKQFFFAVGLTLIFAVGCGSIRNYKAWKAVEDSCAPDVFNSACSLAQAAGKADNIDEVKEYIRLIKTYGECIVVIAQHGTPSHEIKDIERMAQSLNSRPIH